MFYCWLILNLSLCWPQNVSGYGEELQVVVLFALWFLNKKCCHKNYTKNCWQRLYAPHLYISMGDGRLSFQAWDFSMEMYEAAGSWVKHQQTLWGSYHILIEKIIQWAVLVVMAYQPARRKDCTTTKFLPGIMPDSSLSKDMVLTVTVLRRAWINKTII